VKKAMEIGTRGDEGHEDEGGEEVHVEGEADEEEGGHHQAQGDGRGSISRL